MWNFTSCSLCDLPLPKKKRTRQRQTLCDVSTSKVWFSGAEKQTFATSQGECDEAFLCGHKMGPILEGIKSWCKLVCCLFFGEIRSEHTKGKYRKEWSFGSRLSKISWPAFFSFAESKIRWSETSTPTIREATPSRTSEERRMKKIWSNGQKKQVAILSAPFLGEVRMTNFPKRVGIWCEILNWFLRSRRMNYVFVLTFGWFIFQINQWNLHELQVTAFSFIGDRFVKMFLEMSMNIKWSGWHYFHPHTIEAGWTAKASTTCREVSPKNSVRSRGL